MPSQNESVDSLYSNEVRNYIFSRPWPKGLRMDVFEDDYPGPHLNLVFYRDNWLTFDGEDQKYISELVAEVIMKLRKDGIPAYFGKMKHAPPR